jgi:hypothetical protein
MGILRESGQEAGQASEWLPVMSGALALRLGSELPPSLEV